MYHVLFIFVPIVVQFSKAEVRSIKKGFSKKPRTRHRPNDLGQGLRVFCRSFLLVSGTSSVSMSGPTEDVKTHTLSRAPENTLLPDVFSFTVDRRGWTRHTPDKIPPPPLLTDGGEDDNSTSRTFPTLVESLL